MTRARGEAERTHGRLWIEERTPKMREDNIVLIESAILAAEKRGEQSGLEKASKLVWAHRYNAGVTCDTFAEVGIEIDQLSKLDTKESE